MSSRPWVYHPPRPYRDNDIFPDQPCHRQPFSAPGRRGSALTSAFSNDALRPPLGWNLLCMLCGSDDSGCHWQERRRLVRRGRVAHRSRAALPHAPHDRLHALQTRSTLERCADSVAALTRHERALAAWLALAHALGGRADDEERRPCVLTALFLTDISSSI